MSRSPATPDAARPEHPTPYRFLADYRSLLDVPGFWRMAVIGMTSKLAASMTGLSLLLLVSGPRSYGTAGLAVSCSALGQGLSAPLRGRLVDRLPIRPVLLGCLAAHLAATIAVILAVRNAAGTVLVCSLAAAVGASAPPVAVMMRSVWHSVTTGTTLRTAMALDASMTGAALIIGPVLAGWLGLSLSPLLPYAAITTLTVTGVILVVVNSSAVVVPPAAAGHLRGLWASPALRRLLAAEALFVTAVTALDVVLPIHARQENAAGLAGLYLGGLAVGSVVGSFALGTATNRLSPGLALPVLLGVFALGCAALAVAAGLSPTAVLLVCPVAGLVIGSLFALLRTTGGDLAPAGQVTETMSWLSTVDLAGGAAGAAVFAHLADAEGSRTALVLVPVVAATAAVAGRRVRTHPCR
ncbi:MFS transporter [Kitasatospora arboriphila]|uniref:Major facilitator superfamily (MFS) profile domain-containing protein n=1 Tax=Kitasatospora arboriphila TaxID=258052 RepID=A0ABP4EC66_9ACTN